MNKHMTRPVALLAVLGLAVAACGGDDDTEPAATEPAATDEMSDDEMSDDEMSDDEMSDDEMSDDEMSDDEMSDDEMSDDEMSDDEMSDDEMSDDEMSDDENAASGDPIVIGAALDLTANMAPFDAPALAAAQVTIDQINADGGVGGRPLQLDFVDTALDPDQTKQAAADLLSSGAEILVTTCDVDFATPAVQEGLDAGVLTVAPCIGTDQMGPARFGDAGRLAFTFGNAAQDEGAVLAEWAFEQGWTTAIVVPDNLLAYFQDVCNAFTNRWEELGGTVVATEGFASLDGSVNNIPTAVNSAGDADVIALCTFPPDIATAVGGVRDIGNDTPIVSPWSGDGTFWSPEDLTGFTFSTYASVFGDDPNADVQALIDELTARDAAPATGGFITGSGMIEALAAAIEATGGTDGEALADYFEALSGLDTVSGQISFSPDLHSVFGREYRIMTFENGTPVFQELRAATSPADIG